MKKITFAVTKKDDLKGKKNQKILILELNLEK